MSSRAEVDRAQEVAGFDVRGFGSAVYQRFRDADGSEAAAALAYRLAVALLPFLIFATAMVAAIVQAVAGEEPAAAAIAQIDSLLSDRVADGLEQQLRQVANTPLGVPLAGGFLAMVWTGLLRGQSVVRNLNQIHSLREERSRLRVAMVALAVSLASSVAAVLAVVVLLAGSMDPEESVSGLGIGEGLGVAIDILRWPVALLLLTGAAGLTYSLAPARRAHLPAIVAGSLVFGTAWTITSGVLAFYITNLGGFAQTYGALTGIAALLIWVYLTSLAFVIGAVLHAELEARRV